MTVRTVSVKLAAQVTDYMAKLGQAKQATGLLLKEIDKLGKESPEKFNRIALGIGGMGVALLGVAGYAVKAAMEFDKQMSAVGSVAGATSAQMDSLREAALAAGKATQFSATEAAQAEEELAKAGISVRDILGGGLTGALSLAAAGQMDLADAATISAQAMNVFKLQGSAVPHIADVLAASANKSAADMHGLGDGLRQGGLVASQFGLSLEDTVGTLSAFADRALVGSDAGTSLKSMLTQLAAPSAKSAGLMKELGLNVYDASGQFIGITKLAGLLQDKLGGLTQAQRDNALAQIFGTDAMRSANVLYSLGEKGLRGYIDAVDDSGAAAETARKKTDNLAGDLERLRGAVETLAIEAGSGANGGLRILVKSADALVSSFSSLPGPVQTTTTVLAGVAGASLLAAAGLLKVRQTVNDTLSALEGMGPAGVRAAAGLRSFAGIAGRLGLVGLAVGGIWMGLDALSDWAARKRAPLKADIDKLTQSLKEFARTGQVAGELAAKYGSSLEKIGKDAAGIISGQKQLAAQIDLVRQGLSDPSVLNGWDPVDPQALQRVKDLDTALAGMVTSGGATQAALALERLRTSGALSASEFAQLNSLLPNYNDAAKAAATANSGLAKGFADASTAAGILSGSLQEAIDKGQTLTDVWKSLHGAVMASDQAMLEANKAVADIKKSFDENGKAIAGNTTKALENRVAVEKAAKAAAEAAQAKYDETGSVTEATKVYDSYIAQIRTTLIKLTGNKKAVDDLLSSIAKMPPSVTTEIKTPGLATANDRVRALGAAIAKLPSSKTIHITTYDKYISLRPSAGNRWGGLYEHAAEGALRDANIYSPMGPARYAFAEPATGGEAFIPRYGDYGRSMSILSQAARWYGANIVPRQAMGGATTVVEHRHVLVVEGTGVLAGLRREIKFLGGDVQSALGSRTRVGG